MTTENLLKLSAASYEISNKPDVETTSLTQVANHFNEITEGSFQNITVHNKANTDSGLDAYHMTVTTNNTDHECYIFTGSQLNDGDWEHNISNGIKNLKSNTELTKQSKDLEDFINNNPPKNNQVYVSGHSLGGGHAQDAAVKLQQNNQNLKIQATTINSAPSSYQASRYYHSMDKTNINIDNYYTNNDILKKVIGLGDIQPIGNKYLIPVAVGHNYASYENGKLVSKIKFKNGEVEKKELLTSTPLITPMVYRRVTKAIDSTNILINQDNLKLVIKELNNFEFTHIYALLKKMLLTYDYVKQSGYTIFLSKIINEEIDSEEILQWQRQIGGSPTIVNPLIFITNSKQILRQCLFSKEVIYQITDHIKKLQQELESITDNLNSVIVYFVKLDKLLNLLLIESKIIKGIMAPKPKISEQTISKVALNYIPVKHLTFCDKINQCMNIEPLKYEIEQLKTLVHELSQMIIRAITSIKNNADSKATDTVISELTRYNNIYLDDLFNEITILEAYIKQIP